MADEIEIHDSKDIINILKQKKYLLFFDDYRISRQKVYKCFYELKNKYGDFGFIITNLGIFVNEIPDFQSSNLDDLYYELINKGVICIRNEFFDYYS